MAQHQDQSNHHNKKTTLNSKSDQLAVRKSTPKIVDRVYRYPVVNMAITLGYSQYDKLKSSSVTVGEVMAKAESLAAYVWRKVSPIVEKFQEPINKADRLACDTLDFVEDKIGQMTGSNAVAPLFR